MKTFKRNIYLLITVYPDVYRLAHLSHTDGHSVRGDRVLTLSADIFQDGRLLKLYITSLRRV